MQSKVKYSGTSITRNVDGGTVQSVLRDTVLTALDAPEVSRLKIVDASTGQAVSLSTNLYDGMTLELDVKSCEKA